MKPGAWASLSLALATFAVFCANVASGAAGAGAFMGDIPEMLTLLAAAILFVIGVLALEATEKKTTRKGGPRNDPFNRQD
jgi:ABC-type nickel/cobalt efflux system permease component RcnA